MGLKIDIGMCLKFVGWWRYDERSNKELEAAYGRGDPACSVLVAGSLYTIQFDTMVQWRRTDPSRRRRVRRDTAAFPAKGIKYSSKLSLVLPKILIIIGF